VSRPSAAEFRLNGETRAQWLRKAAQPNPRLGIFRTTNFFFVEKNQNFVAGHFELAFLRWFPAGEFSPKFPRSGSPVPRSSWPKIFREHVVANIPGLKIKKPQFPPPPLFFPRARPNRVCRPRGEFFFAQNTNLTFFQPVLRINRN